MSASASETSPALRWALIGLIVVVGGLALQWGWTTAREVRQPTGEAEWIWRRNVSQWSGPLAFYAVRDIELERVPSEARLLVMGDEEYVLFLNGKRVGGNRFAVGAPMDVYSVESMLTEGNNRITVHLRSSKGEGAFLAALFLDDASEPMLVSNEDWRVVRRWGRHLYRPWMPVKGQELALRVERPPVGRWGSTRHQLPRPLYDALALGTGGLRPQRVALPGEAWQRVAQRGNREPLPRGDFVLLDWRQVVSGFVTLRLARSGTSTGLVYFGVDLPDPVEQTPDAFVIGTPGQSYWEDAEPRRFRYIYLVGLAVDDARVVLMDSTELEPVPGGAPPRGVFGLPAPRLRSATEDKIWRKLERFPRPGER